MFGMDPANNFHEVFIHRLDINGNDWTKPVAGDHIRIINPADPDQWSEVKVDRISTSGDSVTIHFNNVAHTHVGPNGDYIPEAGAGIPTMPFDLIDIHHESAADVPGDKFWVVGAPVAPVPKLPGVVGIPEVGDMLRSIDTDHDGLADRYELIPRAHGPSVPTGGTNGQVLTIVSGQPTWRTPTVAGRTTEEIHWSEGSNQLAQSQFTFDERFHRVEIVATFQHSAGCSMEIAAVVAGAIFTKWTHANNTISEWDRNPMAVAGAGSDVLMSSRALVTLNISLVHNGQNQWRGEIRAVGESTSNTTDVVHGTISLTGTSGNPAGIAIGSWGQANPEHWSIEAIGYHR